jgi:hypothetical protein
MHFVLLPADWDSLDKAYVRAHTRTLPSGKTVHIPAYFTRRVAHPKEGAKERAPHALKQAPARGAHPGQTHEQLAHRLVRHVHEGTMSHEEAEANLAHLERRAHAGHHLEHGTGRAWTPEETHQFIAHARGRLAEHREGQARAAAEHEAQARQARWAAEDEEAAERKRQEASLATRHVASEPTNAQLQESYHTKRNTAFAHTLHGIFHRGASYDRSTSHRLALKLIASKPTSGLDVALALPNEDWMMEPALKQYRESPRDRAQHDAAYDAYRTWEQAGQQAQAQRIEALTGKQGEQPSAPSQGRYQVKSAVERGTRRYHLVDTTTGQPVHHPTYGHVMAFQHKEDAQAWADREHARLATRQAQAQERAAHPGQGPPRGITAQQRQEDWDARMRERQAAERRVVQKSQRVLGFVVTRVEHP